MFSNNCAYHKTISSILYFQWYTTGGMCVGRMIIQHQLYLKWPGFQAFHLNSTILFKIYYLPFIVNIFYLHDKPR